MSTGIRTLGHEARRGLCAQRHCRVVIGYYEYYGHLGERKTQPSGLGMVPREADGTSVILRVIMSSLTGCRQGTTGHTGSNKAKGLVLGTPALSPFAASRQKNLD